MAARIMPMGHKDPTGRALSAVSATLSAAESGGVPGDPATRIRNARNAHRRQLHNRIVNARANSTHLRPALQNRKPQALTGFGAEITPLGRRV